MSRSPERHRQKTTRMDEAYRRLKQEILENRLPPGYQAMESDLAENLRMSRTPVREALIRLQNEGMVEIIPRRGMRVLPLSASDMREIYEVLTCIESEAAALLAQQKPDENELAPLINASAAMEEAIEMDDLEAWSKADSGFHRGLMDLCGNRRFADIASKYLDQAHRARLFTLRLRQKPRRSTRDHKEHIRLILKGESEQVRRSYRQHRERTRQELMEIIGKYKINTL